jgi:DNA-binding GntR family transcriptional regulator
MPRMKPALTMPDLGPLEIDRKSTAEMVADSLRERLLAGQFQPGTPMRETSLASRLQVARATTREALQYLLHEGLLTYHMHRGMVVTDLSVADVMDIYNLRALLELAAISHASEAVVDVAPLERAHEALASAHRAADIAAIVEADMDFHHQLVRWLGSPRLESCHSAALGQLRLVLNLLDRSKGGLDTQAREHRQILRLVNRGDFVDASALLRRHLATARDGLVGFLTPLGQHERVATSCARGLSEPTIPSPTTSRSSRRRRATPQ